MMIKKKILIIDDQEINRKILRKILSASYSIVEAENGAEALNLLRTQGGSISAILLDLVMPVLDGYGVLRELAKEPELAAIPVIVVSQADKEDCEASALLLGARDFITKPYNATVLLRRLNNLIELYESNVCIDRIERDSLTGLYNKNAFCRHAADLMGQHSDRSYLLIATDIERFKLINDSFGSAAGDQLLQVVGQYLDAHTQSCGGICARHNADHFVALVPKTIDDGSLHALVSDAEQALAAYPLDKKISLKFGVYPVDDSETPISLMCDRAILAAESGKGHYNSLCSYYDDTIRQKLLREQQLVDDMKAALMQGQFEVYLQPKYDLESELIAGAEALVRWIHPTLGFISPSEFIPLFEQNGFITELDQYVWNQTCALIAGWIRDFNKYVPISVNVSRRDIYQANLPELLTHMVTQHGLKPYHLHLEITETAYTENPEQLIAVVEQLKRQGFSIEMDDFGSGYSSLNMLSELPIDILKLDMTLIQRESDKNSRRNILSFVISLAKWMNLLVVAEGVETQEQINLLRNLDCTYVQGYYYAKPMPSKEFTALFVTASLAAPLQLLQTGPDDAPLTERTQGKEKLMLIVDSNSENRHILAGYFHTLYTVIEFMDEQTAYRCLQENFDEIAIILLRIPSEGGGETELLEKLRANVLYSDIPLIATGTCGEKAAFTLGANDYIALPYDMDIALHRVQNVTAHNAIQLLDREKRMVYRLNTLEQRATLDPLTQLYNRSEMESRLTHYFSPPGKHYGMFLMLDVDDFKSVNDKFGHQCGDSVLRRVASILKDCFRSEDLICRMGGDEFAAFVPEPLNTDQVSFRMHAILSKLSFQAEQLTLSCSIGICLAPEYGTSFLELYHHADIALLIAKRLGKNQYQIYGKSSKLPEPILYRNMDWILDESSDAVYICDVKTYELLYVNRAACLFAHKEKEVCLGMPCYQAIWNLNQPCSHCIHIGKLTRNYCEHEYHTPGMESSYIIKGKLIRWGNREARIQYLQDNTQQARMTQQLEQVTNTVPGALCLYRWDGAKLETVHISQQFIDILDLDATTVFAEANVPNSGRVHPDDWLKLRQQMDEAIFHARDISCVFRLWLPAAQKYRWLRIQATSRTQADDSVLIYALYTDVTELQELWQPR
ncbi:EAL domain-containing protein [Butyricicoccus sp. Marseille-Q5471]|uniref:EAL domain-containing protein n=1 Tax=Butyricicoccus sp. Marseille-Q5471 TaxID=3039493 RepID=UPI0024BC37DB|nr:EAL domain-containing protein [Butyricicoccus sp. Marseille-Q5471]